MNTTKFTRGPVFARDQMLVAAFNAATAAQDMGFDGIKAVEALPQLLALLKDSECYCADYIGAKDNPCPHCRASAVLANQKPRSKDYDTPEGA